MATCLSKLLVTVKNYSENYSTISDFVLFLWAFVFLFAAATNRIEEQHWTELRKNVDPGLKKRKEEEEEEEELEVVADAVAIADLGSGEGETRESWGRTAWDWFSIFFPAFCLTCCNSVSPPISGNRVNTIRATQEPDNVQAIHLTQHFSSAQLLFL